MEYTQNSFTSSNGILAFPDHFVAYGVTLAKDHALATVVGTKKIVKAGTVYPANDATAKGIVLNDVDVTNGDANAAILIHGFVKAAALPVAVADLAKPSLKGIFLMPV